VTSLLKGICKGEVSLRGEGTAHLLGEAELSPGEVRRIIRE